MDIRKRLLRRPLTTVLWMVLVTAMVLLLSVGTALWYSSHSLIAALDDMYTAVAVRTDREIEPAVIHQGQTTLWTYEEKHLMQEDVDFLESLDCVEQVCINTLTGGYSPDFSPVLGLSRLGISDTYQYANESYDWVMLVGRPVSITRMGGGDGRYSMEVNFEITQNIQMHEDYQIEVGDIVNCDFMISVEDPNAYFMDNKQFIFFGELRLATTPQISIQDYSQNETENEYYLAELTCSVEEFLSNPENERWADLKAMGELANHCLPIIGTECLEGMYGFVNSDATLVEGRMFTQEEYDTGARVCILSETVAINSGISLGDTIDMSQFLVEISQITNYAADTYYKDGMLNNPTLGTVTSRTELATDAEAFTVVGLYRQINPWVETSYSFSPNTVFIPQKAQLPGGFGGVSTWEENWFLFDTETTGYSFQTGYRDNGGYGIYLTVILEKGRMAEFTTALLGTNLEGEFITLDQGYEAIIGSVQAVRDSALELLGLACAGWVLLLALYVLLYQGGQRKNLGTMRSLGAKPVQARRYLFGGGMALAAVSITLGTVLAGSFLERINGYLTEQMTATQEGTALTAETIGNMVTASQLPAQILAGIAVVQLAVMALTLWLHARSLSRKEPRKLLGV